MPLYPLIFHPIFKERVWGGRNLNVLYRKPLPPDVPIGESWEIADRPGEVSVVANGPLAGKDLHWLMEHHPRELLGEARSHQGRFPLLIKLLDAEEKLSLQVHPPADKAAALGGEPKTEMWYIARARAGAELYVGLKRGVTRESFERQILNGEVAESFHRLPVRAGDAMFLPSGRVHAIGSGLVIFEIQQNSDTTYRVFDWKRVGLDGKPREVHVEQSLASIDFEDFEPALVDAPFSSSEGFRVRTLAKNALFKVDQFQSSSPETLVFKQSRLRIIGQVENQIKISDGTTNLEIQPGQFTLIPACVQSLKLDSEPGSNFLVVEIGR